ncbi:MAG: ATP-binding protein [Acidobacteria bacterium]|nr:ATP-binding protein [Acidobacteriota bacterium]
MTEHQKSRILASRRPASFIGREAALTDLSEKACGERFRGSIVLHKPRSGATELLQQFFDRQFHSAQGAAPVYFSFPREGQPIDIARSFLSEYLVQVLAFRRQDAGLVSLPPLAGEISAIANAGDASFFAASVRLLSAEPLGHEKETFIRRCFSIPLAAAAAGIVSFVMIDNAEEIDREVRNASIARAFEVLARAERFPFLFAAQRRSGFAIPDVPREVLPEITDENLRTLIATAAAERGVSIGEAPADLLAVQTSGDLSAIHGILDSTRCDSVSLEDFSGVGSAYVDSVFGGAVREIYSKVLERVFPGAGVEREAIRLLHEAARENTFVPLDVFRSRLGMSDEAAVAAAEALNTVEVIRFTAGRIEAAADNKTFRDFLTISYRLEVRNETRALVYAETLAGFLTNAPREMASVYRRSAAVGVRGLMAEFGGREVPAALFDYGRFKQNYKGIPRDELLGLLRDDEKLISLPKIVFSAQAEAFYKAIGTISESERAAVAVGFQADEGGTEPIAWIAAEIDSKFEAERGKAEFWCDRLEAAAINCGFERYRLWLIAPEGFNDDALTVLNERGCYASSRMQADLLRIVLEGSEGETDTPAADSYEIVIPIDEDSEIVAAHTLEDIARRHDIPAAHINQIKTALIEACINAAEHSLSPDRRIHQKFVVAPDRITITVSNRGLRLADKPMPAREPGEGRRGWGLQLIKVLMDEVKLEDVDDGTRLTMTKYFDRLEASAAAA